MVLISISTSASCTLCEALGSETASTWISRNTLRVPSRNCRKPRSPTPPSHSKISMSIATTWPRCVELKALRQRPAYSDGQSLIDLRNHVASQATAKQTAQDDAQQFERRRVEAARGVVDVHGAFTSTGITS